VAGQIGHPAAIAPLVVIPGVDLELGAARHHRGEGVNDGAARIVDVVDRYQWPGFVAKDSLQGAVGGGLKGGIDLVCSHGTLQLEHRIGEGSIEQRHPNGMAVELALQLGKDQPNRPGRAGGGRDQRLQAGAGPAQVALEGIHHHLGVGHIVQGGDRTVANAEALLHHLHHRRQAVGGAGGSGEQAMAEWVVVVLIDAINDIERLLSGDLSLYRAGHDHALEARRTEVGLEGFGGFDLAAAFEHQIHTGAGPGHGGGILLLAVANGLAGHPEAIRFGVKFLGPAAMHRIEFEQMGGGGGISRRVVDVNQLNAGAAPEGTEH